MNPISNVNVGELNQTSKRFSFLGFCTRCQYYILDILIHTASNSSTFAPNILAVLRRFILNGCSDTLRHLETLRATAEDGMSQHG